MAVMTCQKSYSSSTSYDSCSESGKWFQSSMDLTLSGPCLDADFLVADSKFMKVAFGVGFKMLLFNPLVFSMKDLSRNLKLTVSNSSLGEDFPTGKDNVIVSTGRTKVIPAGRTILVLPIRHPQPATAAAAAGKAVAAAVVAAVAWEDGGTRLNGWRGWRSAAKIRQKNSPEKFSAGDD
ncbi:hypothetical protein Tco_1285522 [Tanacetum coccineum]